MVVKRKKSWPPRSAGDSDLNSKVNALEKVIAALQKENAELKKSGGKQSVGDGQSAQAPKECGWSNVEHKTKKKHKAGVVQQSTAGETSKPKVVEMDTFNQDGWSAPVLRCSDGIKGDTAGVFLCSAVQAQQYKAELCHLKVPLAALSPQRISEQDVFIDVPVTNPKGRCESMWRYLVQLGSTPVSYDVQMEKVVPRQ